MPAIKNRDVDRSRQKIEAAALKIFTKQGYHGTSMREIADASGFSIGNLYNHYATKEKLFETLVEKYEARFSALRAKALAGIDDAFQMSVRRIVPDQRNMGAGGTFRIHRDQPSGFVAAASQAAAASSTKGVTTSRTRA